MQAPVRQRSLWRHNLALVLRHAVTAAPTSRAALATATGLTRATVSSLVDDLLRARLLVQTPPAPRTGAGRPAAGLVPHRDGPAGLGLEINVDYLAACVVDLTGSVRHRHTRPVDQRGRPPEQVMADVAAMAARAASATGLPLAGARLAVPGLVRADGLVRVAPNLGWREVDAAALLAGRPDWPGLTIAVDNEANLAALGELATDGAPGSFVYVSGEVGIGAGIVLAGHLFRGARGFSGELGHVPVHPDGPRCGCGARGCLEQYAGQEAILRAAGPGTPAWPADGTGPAGAARAPGPAGTATGPGTIDELADAARRGGPHARAALHQAGTALGVALSGVVNLLDLDAVVLGGTFATLAEWLVEPVEAQLRARVLTARFAPVPVRACPHGRDATVRGAAGAVVADVLAAPADWVPSPRPARA